MAPLPTTTTSRLSPRPLRPKRSSRVTSLPVKVLVIGSLLLGAWAAGGYRTRLQSNQVLETYAASHPEHADLAQAIVACNSKFVVNIEQCGADLLARFGSDALLQQMTAMAGNGAFGELPAR